MCLENATNVTWVWANKTLCDIGDKITEKKISPKHFNMYLYYDSHSVNEGKTYYKYYVFRATNYAEARDAIKNKSGGTIKLSEHEWNMIWEDFDEDGSDTDVFDEDLK